jgi:hypothetical protein
MCDAGGMHPVNTIQKLVPVQAQMCAVCSPCALESACFCLELMGELDGKPSQVGPMTTGHLHKLWLIYCTCCSY